MSDGRPGELDWIVVVAPAQVEPWRRILVKAEAFPTIAQGVLGALGIDQQTRETAFAKQPPGPFTAEEELVRWLALELSPEGEQRKIAEGTVAYWMVCAANKVGGLQPGAPPTAEWRRQFAEALRAKSVVGNAIIAGVERGLRIVLDQAVAQFPDVPALVAGAEALTARAVEYLEDYASQAPTPPTGERALPVVADIFRRSLASIPTDHATQALLEAIHNGVTRKGWSDGDGQTAPTHKTPTNHGRGVVYVSVRDASGEEHPSEAELPALWDKVRQLDDITSDVLLVCLAHWVDQGAEPKGPVWVTCDAILDARGIRRKKYANEPKDWQHGHRREDRVEVGRAISALDNLWIRMVDVEVIPARQRKKARRLRLSSRAFAVVDRFDQLDFDGRLVPLAVRIMPGQWAEAYWELGLRWVGLLAQKALYYDPYRQRPEKRLAKYLAFQYRINAGAAARNLKVGELLEIAGLDQDPARPERVRTRLHAALDTLAKDGVMARWEYPADAPSLPARKWLDRWRAQSVLVVFPEEIHTRYASIRSGNSASRKLPERAAPLLSNIE